MRPYTLGIDLHKRSSVWVLLDGKGNEVWKDSVPCHPDHITRTLKRLPASGTDVQAALEPTCGWRWVAALLEEAGVEVHPANVNKVRLIAESTQKHDLGDARALANLLRLGYLPESYRVPDAIHGLRLILRHRAYLVRLRVSVKNRPHGVATTQGLHHIARGNPLSKSGKAGIMAGDDSSLKELHTLVEELDSRIAECDARCEVIAKGEPLVPILRTMPGIGIVSALTIIAEVGDFTRFPSAKRLSSFAGLIPRQRSSGDYERFEHAGDAWLNHKNALPEEKREMVKILASEIWVQGKDLKVEPSLPFGFIANWSKTAKCDPHRDVGRRCFLTIESLTKICVEGELPDLLNLSAHLESG